MGLLSKGRKSAARAAARGRTGARAGVDMVRARPDRAGDQPVRNPRDFAKPLAIGAPEPIREVPLKPSRMIHFFDPANEKMAAKLPDLAARCDILLGNLEDAVPVDRKEAAREGLVRVGREVDLGEC